MGQTLRSVAGNERFHLCLTLWQTEAHRTRNTVAYRAATGVLSNGGGTVTVTLPDASTVIYPPTLDADTAVGWVFGVAPQSIPIRLLWHRDDATPGIDWQRAVAELSLFNETRGGRGVDVWTARHVMAYGNIDSIEWDHVAGLWSFRIVSRGAEDGGDFYPPGRELSSARHSAIDTDTDRARARNSLGLLPPRVYAPIGSNLRSPCACVSNDAAGVSGVSDYVPYRYLVTDRRMCSATSAQKFLMPDANSQGRALARASAIYQKTPTEQTDSLGDSYWRINADFENTFGASSVTFTAASPSFTATKTGGLCRVGWAVKSAGDGADDYLIVGSMDGDSGELVNDAGASTNYGGAGAVGDEGTSIPLPADVPDSLFWNPDLGGIAGSDGTPITHICDVVRDLLTYCRMPVQIAYGDLIALRSRLTGMDCSLVIRERGIPWQRVLDLLALTPIRPYLYQGALRFGWAGPVTDLDVVAEYDLDDVGPIYRAEPIRWIEEPIYPVVTLRWWWDIWEGRHRRGLTLDGNAQTSTATLARCGRSLTTAQTWQASQRAGRDSSPRWTVETDGLELQLAGTQAAQWLTYLYGYRRQAMRVIASPSMRWLKPGNVIRLTETYATRRSQLWRVEGLTLDGRGQLALMLEETIV